MLFIDFKPLELTERQSNKVKYAYRQKVNIGES